MDKHHARITCPSAGHCLTFPDGCLEERKTAAEYFRRQQLLDVERRALRFQARSARIKMLLSMYLSEFE